MMTTTEESNAGTTKKRKRRKKRFSRSERELRSRSDRSMRVTLSNIVDMRILLLLYLHKCLHANQIHRLLPGPIQTYNVSQVNHSDDYSEPIRIIKLKSLLNKLRLLVNRGVIKRTLSTEKSSEVIDTFDFVLTDLGLKALLEYLDIPKFKIGDPEEKLYHYKMDQFVVRKTSQKNHNFCIQEWVSRITSDLYVNGIHLPGCEWRRFFDGNPDHGNIAYKPDWLFFKPNEFHDVLLEFEPELKKQKEKLSQQKAYPFIYPLKTRDHCLKMVYQNMESYLDWKDAYQPFIYFELDSNTMKHHQLNKKYANIRENVAGTVDLLVFVSNINELDVKEGDSTERAQNVRETMLKQFKRDLTLEKLDIIHGNQTETMEAVKDYIYNSYSFLRRLEMSDIHLFQVLLDNHNRITGSNARVYHTDSLEAKEIFPYIKEFDNGLPDYVIIQDKYLDHHRSGNPIGKTVDFVYLTRKYWFNPQAKAILYQEWVNKGKWLHIDVRVVLMYPSKDEMEIDIFTTDKLLLEPMGGENIRNDFGRVSNYLRFIDFESVKKAGVWDHLFRRVRSPNRKGVFWSEVKLYENRD